MKSKLFTFTGIFCLVLALIISVNNLIDDRISINSQNKLIEAYAYSGTNSAQQIEGIQGVDYAIQDYGAYYDLSGSYPGLSKSGMIQASSEFAQGRIISSSTAQRIVDEGYGGTMIFSLNPKNGYAARFSNFTVPFYGEETVQTGSYAKDW